MKRSLFLLVLIICLTMVACINIDSKTENTSKNTEGVTTVPVTTPDVSTTTPNVSAQTTAKRETDTPVTTTNPPVTDVTQVTTTTSLADTPITTTTAVTTTQTPDITTTQTPDTTPVTTPEGYGLVPQSAAVDKSYFDDAAFIGDSISLKLKTYCLSGALGKANFFTVGSFSTVNALSPVSENSTHPSYQGTKMLAEDCVAACGAKKVYIMLGMNDLSYGIDATIERYKTLVLRILDKSPDVEIFIQSMTPMRKDSRVWGSKLNNTSIREYNARLLELCKEMGWYYIDVQSIMWDDAGEQLRLDYCSDAGTDKMGMHMSSAGCKAWVNYLLTHTVNFSN